MGVGDTSRTGYAGGEWAGGPCVCDFSHLEEVWTGPHWSNFANLTLLGVEIILLAMILHSLYVEIQESR